MPVDEYTKILAGNGTGLDTPALKSLSSVVPLVGGAQELYTSVGCSHAADVGQGKER